MTPKEKAKEIHSKIAPYIDLHDNIGNINHELWHQRTKQCALIAADETSRNLERLCISPLGTYTNPKIVFWQEVKQEIEKL